MMNCFFSAGSEHSGTFRIKELNSLDKEAVVQRFYLNLRRGETSVAPDDEGADFASIEEAYLESFKGAQELWPELLRHRQDPRQYAFEITDRDGAVVMELPFAEIVDSCRRVGPMAVSAPPKSTSAALTKSALLEALESAHNLNRKSADLLAAMRAAQQSVTDVEKSTRAIGRNDEGVTGNRPRCTAVHTSDENKDHPDDVAVRQGPFFLLAGAHRFVLDGTERASRQREIVAQLERGKHDTQRAKELLALIEDALAMAVTRRDRLASDIHYPPTLLAVTPRCWARS
jgi:hypothetical protein